MLGVFKKQLLKNNEKIFGLDKMKFLFKEFQDKVKNDLRNLEVFKKEEDRESFRAVFHTLRSAALVFGISKFAKICEKIEDEIIAGESLISLEKEIKKAKIALEEGIKKVKEHLNG